jgi:hypothetical protein
MTPRFRKHVLWGITSLAFGWFLIAFGGYQGLFENDGRWFAVTILALCWIVTVGFLGRYFRHNL